MGETPGGRKDLAALCKGAGVGGLAHEFQWTVGDYINAVLTAGCEVLTVEEFGTGSDGVWEVPPVGRLPRVLLVVGRK